MKTIAIINSKGGVGKTTTAYALCAALAARGLRVVGIDLDPQAFFTEWCDAAINTESVALADQLTEDILSDGSCVRSTKEGFFVVPYSHLMNKISSGQIDLSSIVKKLSTDPSGFDFCIIDTSPMVDAGFLAAMTIANKVIIPTEISVASLYRLSQLAGVIETIQKSNPHLTVDGLLLTMCPYAEISPEQKRSLQEIAAQFGSRVYNAIIPEDLNIAEAAFYKKNFLTEYICSPATEGYLSFTDEFLMKNAK